MPRSPRLRIACRSSRHTERCHPAEFLRKNLSVDGGTQSIRSRVGPSSLFGKCNRLRRLLIKELVALSWTVQSALATLKQVGGPRLLLMSIDTAAATHDGVLWRRSHHSSVDDAFDAKKSIRQPAVLSKHANFDAIRILHDAPRASSVRSCTLDSSTCMRVLPFKTLIEG